MDDHTQKEILGNVCRDEPYEHFTSQPTLFYFNVTLIERSLRTMVKPVVFFWNPPSRILVAVFLGLDSMNKHANSLASF